MKVKDLTKPESVSTSAGHRDGVSPTPWRVVTDDDSDECYIYSAQGTPVCTMSHFPENPEADAALIVEAVNAVDVTLKLKRTLLGWSIERDRLRDIVRRLADIVRHDCDERAMAVTREAYAALGEEVPE